MTDFEQERTTASRSGKRDGPDDRLMLIKKIKLLIAGRVLLLSFLCLSLLLLLASYRVLPPSQFAHKANLTLGAPLAGTSPP